MGGGNNPVSINQVIKQIESYLGKRCKKQHKLFHKADMMTSWADISKAERLLNWKPKVSLSDGIKKTVQWYLSNLSWSDNVQNGSYKLERLGVNLK